MDDNYKCPCGHVLGELQGNWWVYPNPAICSKCGKDNTKSFNKWFLYEMVGSCKPRKRKIKLN